jgi:hypothetical protein
MMFPTSMFLGERNTKECSEAHSAESARCPSESASGILYINIKCLVDSTAPIVEVRRQIKTIIELETLLVSPKVTR